MRHTNIPSTGGQQAAGPLSVLRSSFRTLCGGAVALGFVMAVAPAVHAQGNPPQSCPADPIAAMQTLQQQIDVLYANVVPQAKAAAADLKTSVGDPGALSLKIAQYEELLYQYETQAQLLYEQVREINRCCFRAGKYVVWVELERVTQIWTKTYIKIIRVTVKYYRTYYKYKVKWLNTSTVGCCLCNGVPNPAITNCASAPGLQPVHCNLACLPFTSNGGQWFFQQMCDPATGTCVPDP